VFAKTADNLWWRRGESNSGPPGADRGSATDVVPALVSGKSSQEQDLLPLFSLSCPGGRRSFSRSIRLYDVFQNPGGGENWRRGRYLCSQCV